MKQFYHFSKLTSKNMVRVFFRHEFIFLTLFGNIFIVTAALFFFTVEKQINPKILSLGDALWWAVVTMTTVGYGDIVPVTNR